jgi:N4-gp56 family major capsid protein
MATITSENAALAIVKFVAAKALPVLESNLFMGRLINRDYEATLAQAGDTVNVPVAPRLAANNIAETGTVTPQNAVLGNIPVTLTSHVESTFSIPDVAKALVNVSLAETLMQPAMVAISERVENDILNLGPQFTYTAAMGTSNTLPTEALIDSVEAQFFKNKIPTTAPKYMACSADFYGALRQISRFSEERMIGGDAAPILQGELGKLKNMMFLRSQLIAPVASTTSNLAFTPDSMALVVRKLDLPLPGMGVIATYAEYKNLTLRVLMSYNPNTLGAQFTCDILYGVAPLRQQGAIQVLS